MLAGKGEGGAAIWLSFTMNTWFMSVGIIISISISNDMGLQGRKSGKKLHQSYESYWVLSSSTNLVWNPILAHCQKTKPNSIIRQLVTPCFICPTNIYWKLDKYLNFALFSYLYKIWPSTWLCLCSQMPKSQSALFFWSLFPSLNMHTVNFLTSWTKYAPKFQLNLMYIFMLNL